MTDAQTAANPLPHRRQLAVTWGIPDGFGGMTGALLHRSRLFAGAGARAEVLTFEDRPDYDAVRARLSERGELAGGVVLRNIYEDFRATLRPPAATPPPPPAPARPPDDESVCESGSVHRWREGAEVVRVEHRRADGSLAVLEHRPHPEAPHRLVTAFDARGRTTGQWRSVRSFRFAWVDELLAGEPAVAVVDSKIAAELFQHYRRPRVTLIHLVHGAHHDREGRLTAARRDVFENLDLWDAVAFLTERQRAAAIADVGDSGNLAVVPNAVSIPEWMPRLPPDRLHGVIACRLSRLKRIDHALEVIARVRALGVPVTAEIIGDGSQRRRLEAQAAALGLAEAVEFAGYVPGGARHFTRGAWTLVTSRSEGESLSLLEAMAAGCLPVAYDIPYGPAEVIRNARSGYLVADGSVAAAATALVALCVIDDDRLAAMRRTARRIAQDHSEGAVLARWAEVQDAAVRRHGEWHRRFTRSSLRRAMGRLSRAAARALRG